MHPRLIKSKLVQAGITQADIARDVLVTRQAVCQTIKGTIRSERIERAISRAIAVPRDRVFPPSQHGGRR